MSSVNWLRCKRGFAASTFSISTSATQSGTVGQAFSVGLTASQTVDTWAIVGGADAASFLLQGTALSLTSTITAASYVVIVGATSANGEQASKTITVTLTGSLALTKVANLNVTAVSATSLGATFDAVAGATGYQGALNGDLNRAYDLVSPNYIIGVLIPGTDYSEQVRAKAAGPIYGDWSDADTATTNADSGTNQPSGVNAVQVESFLDSIGFQARLNLQASSSLWRASTGWLTYVDEMTTARGKGLPFRTSYGPATPSSAVTLEIAQMVASYSSKFLLVTNSTGANLVPDIPAMQALVTKAGANIGAANIIGMESLNEPNQPNPATGAKFNVNWLADTLAYQAAYFTACRAEFGSSMPVLSVSPWGRLPADITAWAAGGIGANCDVVTLHYYNSGRPPSTAGAPTGTVNEGNDPLTEVPFSGSDPNSVLNNNQRLKPGAPIWMTENGWNMFNTGGAQNWGGTHAKSGSYVSEAAHAKYLLRMLFEAYMNGVERTFIFEFLENTGSPRDPDSFGLIRATAWTGFTGPFTKHPAFDAIKNLFTILTDVGAPFSPGTLNYSLSGAGLTSAIHHKLLQKRNGHFFLAIWNEAESWKRSTATDAVIADVALTLSLGATYTTVRSYTAYTGTSSSALGSSVSSVSVNVPDHPILVEVF